VTETKFRLRLYNFEGPFDLLLQLIQDRKMDITEVALAEVTDEFIAYTEELTIEHGLDEVTEFLVIAATLLDLKTARLLPQGDMVDPEDLELLEARDLLFARLLQYKAYKQIAEQFADWQQNAPRRYPRSVPPEDKYLNLLPPVELGISAKELGLIAAVAFRPRPVPTVSTKHIHIPTVSVQHEAKMVMKALKHFAIGTPVKFGSLVEDCSQSITVVGRFMSLLELYRMHAIEFSQAEPLEDLFVKWTGEDIDDVQLQQALEEENDVTAAD